MADVENAPPYNAPPYNGDQFNPDGDTPPIYPDGHDPTDPPPSYDSLFGRVKQAKQESSGNVSFMRQFFVIVVSTIGCTVCMAIMLAIPISYMAIGTIYLHDCPVEPFIPIYLIVAGVFGSIRALSGLTQRTRNRYNQDDESNATTNPFDGVLSCFLFGWFIAGNVWIYSNYDNWSPVPSSDNYCQPTLYWFAFWTTTVTYILLAVTCCCVSCASCLAAIVS